MRILNGVIHILNNLRYGISNLWHWFPTIWKDRSDNSYYVYLILYKKLRIMEKFFRKDAHYVGAEKDADDMKICVLLLRRMLYGNRAYRSMFRKYEAKWGEQSYDISVFMDRVPEQQVKDLTEASNYEYRQKIQDKDYLFKMLSKHAEQWVD